VIGRTDYIVAHGAEGALDGEITIFCGHDKKLGVFVTISAGSQD
jgi:hypothetical protein